LRKIGAEKLYGTLLSLGEGTRVNFSPTPRVSLFNNRKKGIEDPDKNERLYIGYEDIKQCKHCFSFNISCNSLSDKLSYKR